MNNLELYTVLFLLFSCKTGNSPEEIQTENRSYETAVDFLGRGKADSAFFYFNQAKDLFNGDNDSLGVAECLINMAIIQTDQGDYFGGQETSLEALAYLDSHNPNHYYYLGSNYNNIGIATYHLKDYKQAITFYNLAIKFSDDVLDKRLYQNNKAKAYHDDKAYAEALKLYEEIIQENSKNQKEYARTLTNISNSKWRLNPDFNAIPDLLKALHIREEQNDLQGQNSSYAHLAEYYEQSRPDSALFYARKRYRTAVRIKSPDDQLKGLNMLIKLSPPDSVKSYFEAYQQLSDSVQLARSAAKNQFALIRYEVEKNKADNLRLQQENAEKAYEVTRQRIMSGAVIFVTLVIGVGGFYWYKRRRQRLELEAENRIRESQLKTSKKVHDVVANGIYQVMTEMENKDQIDRDGVLDCLEDLYEKSRDLSYEHIALKSEKFDEKVSRLLKAFDSERTSVSVTGNDMALWDRVQAPVRYEIERILQELMVNMKKHSRATDVTLCFEQADGYLEIRYSDNGIGLPENLQFKNGLTNTGNRIKNSHGTITFGSNNGKGLSIRITFPLF